MGHENEAQPQFAARKFSLKPKAIKSKYPEYIPEALEPEPIEKAFIRMCSIIDSQEWQRFIALVGKEQAMKWFEAGLNSATRTD